MEIILIEANCWKQKVAPSVDTKSSFDFFLMANGVQHPLGILNHNGSVVPTTNQFPMNPGNILIWLIFQAPWGQNDILLWRKWQVQQQRMNARLVSIRN